MEDPIDLNVSKLLDFLENNKYSKKNVFFYLHELIKTHDRNEKYIASFDRGIIL